MTCVLVPGSPGLASAFGLLIADNLIDLTLSHLHALSDATLDCVRLNGLHDKAREAARWNGFSRGGYEVAVGLDMRMPAKPSSCRSGRAAKPRMRRRCGLFSRPRIGRATAIPGRPFWWRWWGIASV